MDHAGVAATKVAAIERGMAMIADRDRDSFAEAEQNETFVKKGIN